uniref:Reverse transcriptase/retrotransposon-derived protein RNase H-like domain-containing protein n=1 Tax=Hippocampus comes TaxID=109280 RepID=A0A3Q2Z834_HIPCM
MGSLSYDSLKCHIYSKRTQKVQVLRWIIDCPLRGFTLAQHLKANCTLVRPPEADKDFVQLNSFLQSPPTCMMSVLLQRHGGALHPIGYFSNLLDPVARGLLACLRVVAACVLAVHFSPHSVCSPFCGFHPQ